MDFPGLSGIANLGNTCYMNSVLQCLSATDILNHYIRNIYFKDHLREGIKRLYIEKLKKKNKIIELQHNIIKSKFKDSITYRLYQLIIIMWKCRSSLTPKYFKSSVDMHFKTFKGFNQHDAQEFLNSVLDRIHDELKTNIIVDKYNLNNEFTNYVQIKLQLFTVLQENGDNMSDEQKQQINDELNYLIKENINKEVYLNGIEHKIKFLEKNKHSIISELFMGMYMSQVVCTNCKHISITYEPFNMLTLEICNSEMVMFNTLQECIDNFLKPEEVEYSCEKCKKKSKAQKKISIFNMPEKLIIHFKRFKFINGRSAKINSIIDFPFENVYFHEFQDICGQEKCPYELYGVVHHSGGTGGGHYIATTRNTLNFKWYEFNDSQVSLITNPKSIIDRTAYILFYQKKRINEPLYQENELIKENDNIMNCELDEITINSSGEEIDSDSDFDSLR
jgi:ubiquitin C-terminal hydrolase